MQAPSTNTSDPAGGSEDEMRCAYEKIDRRKKKGITGSEGAVNEPRRCGTALMFAQMRLLKE